MAYKNFKIETDADGIALVTWDTPGRSMNVLDETSVNELEAIVKETTADAAVKGVVITSGKEALSAGADLSMLQDMSRTYAEVLKDKGEVAYLLSLSAGKEFEATTDGLKNTDVHLFVYDSSGAEVAKDDSPGPKCSVKVTPEKNGQYKFVIKNAGGANTVTFNVKVAK